MLTRLRNTQSSEEFIRGLFEAYLKPDPIIEAAFRRGTLDVLAGRVPACNSTHYLAAYRVHQMILDRIKRIEK